MAKEEQKTVDNTEDELKDDVEEETKKGGNTEKERAARGVDSVTDYVEEKGTADVSKAVSALEALKDEILAESVEVVTLNDEDVKLLIDECEITKEQAERLLRSQKGNLTEALRYYLMGNPL